MAQKTEKTPNAPKTPAKAVKTAKAPAKPKPAKETGKPAKSAKKPAKAAAPAGAAPTADTGAGASAVPSPSAAARGRQQVKVGRVVSNKMNKTVVVAVENTVTHRLYHRYLKRTSKFAAHDEPNQCNVGDEVEIVSSRPLSRTKRWRVRRIIKRAQ